MAGWRDAVERLQARRKSTKVSTAEEMLVLRPLASDLERSPWLKLTLWIAIIVELLAASALLEVPYFAIEPGGAEDVVKHIDGPPDRATQPTGKILFTTVRVGPTRLLGALMGWLDPDVDVLPEEAILGNVKREDHRERVLQEMDASKETAIAVALRRLGHVVTESGTGGQIVTVFDDLPADGRLEPGDTIMAVDGVPTSVSSEVVQGIKAHNEGEVVRLDVERYETGVRETVELTLVKPKGVDIAVVGIEVQTRNLVYNLPFPVDIDSGAIGGPSAGLAFALGVIDVFSPGELTGGQKVAVTGTIDLQGNVGLIGGVGQKAIAVRDAGIKYFLVPAPEADDARKRVRSGVEIIGVNTLDEALAALGRIGGDLRALEAPGGPAG